MTRSPRSLPEGPLSVTTSFRRYGRTPPTEVGDKTVLPFTTSLLTARGRVGAGDASVSPAPLRDLEKFRCLDRESVGTLMSAPFKLNF